MRILVLSNFYPPHYIGGYEIGCRDVVEGLKDKGHEVVVLTSTYGVYKPTEEGNVYRWLESQAEWKPQNPLLFIFKIFRKEIRNRLLLKRLYRQFQPDLVYIWNLSSVSISLALAAQQFKQEICYYVFDHWLLQAEDDGLYAFLQENDRTSTRVISLVKKLLQKIARLLGLLPSIHTLDLRHVQFATQYLKTSALSAGKPVADGKIIYFGIRPENFPFNTEERPLQRLLYVGQIVEHKGVHTAIEAFALLKSNFKHQSLTLTIAGGAVQPDYEMHLRNLAQSLGVAKNVSFRGKVSRDELSQIYQQHDILIFPSVWDEPFGITLLEAMSSGLAVVGTATGGSGEILQHEVNGLAYPKEDAQACANQVMRLIKNPSLYERLRHQGRKTVEEKFCLKRTIDMINQDLQQIAAKRTEL